MSNNVVDDQIKNPTDVICLYPPAGGYKEIWVTESSYNEAQRLYHNGDDQIAYSFWHNSHGPAATYDVSGEFRTHWWLDNHNYNTFEEWLDANDYIDGDEKLMLKLQYGT